MKDIIDAIFGAPIGTLFIVAGLVFLLIAVAGSIAGKIEPDKPGRIASGVIGALLLIVGLSIHIMTPKSTEQGERGKQVEGRQKGSEPLPLPEIVSFEANPFTIRQGESSTLSWRTSNATEVTLNGGRVGGSDSRRVSPSRTTSYTLIARNEEGQRRSEETTVRVQASARPPEIVSFEASPSTIRQGGSSTLSWRTSNATEVTLNGERVGGSDSRRVSPSRTTSYTLVARNEEGQRQDKGISIRVEVPEAPSPAAGEDCLPYNPRNLRITDEGARGWLLTDGRSRMLVLDDRGDAGKALALARRHTHHCFIGRDNRRPNRRDYIVEYWAGSSGTATRLDSEDCISYNPRNLRITDEGARGWLLTDGRSRMLVLDDRDDAGKALALARRHTQQCFIGRDNRRPNRKDYIVEYWK